MSFYRRSSRRSFLRKAGVTSALGALPLEAATVKKTAGPSVYEALGVKHVINATGTVTNLGASLPPPEVVAAWVDASKHFVSIAELQDKVGEKIAKLLGIEAALVTTGAAGSIMLGTAAAVTRGDRDRIHRIPDTSGMKNEVVIQKSHHSGYDHQMRNVGVKLVDVETRADLDRAINDRTAMMFFMNLADPDGQIKREEWIEVARKHDVPTFVDAAADVPPVEHLSEYNKMGFDMVGFSGGKGLLGPNNTGLLLGRKDLIEAAKLNTNPRGDTIGRMAKVGKEDMVACLAAVERYLRIDHEAEWREFERRLGVIEDSLKAIPTLKSSRVVPPIANHVPHVLFSWDESRVKLTREQLTKELREGNPSIAIGRVAGTGRDGVLISVFQLQKGEEIIVAARLREILKKASA
jgi:L-seryl-tRNA(Ser) seleniumtransferase